MESVGFLSGSKHIIGVGVINRWRRLFKVLKTMSFTYLYTYIYE